ncbi:P-loop containing nucleoside triphosphate hydrolase protein [Multifurca ochricompacta]|uniref:ATP-dependent RNA helicase n=1 Tax=Multifurca ochricompacta TaxID=376703 RepID=A0AAD4QNI2_9AGAM|nr:P-loop containing nucleoside triphosphate hydrolase protein [Multifurca ochricompacta]
MCRIYLRCQKTKAKERYLKGKRERKKQRKAAARESAVAGNVGGRDDGEEDEHDNNGEKDPFIEEERASQEEREFEECPLLLQEDGDFKRLRKRQKLDNEDAIPDHSHLTAAESSPVPSSPISNFSDSLAETSGHRSPTPPLTSLPLFPLPSRPYVPEKSELALQGLDRALARAQVVDPLLSTPLSLDEDGDADNGISAKTVKRLRDLGITELFAVQTALLPLFLPSDRLKRSLYLPYEPPNDICVSAPTGSGKTLAYVLPIIEILSSRVVTRLRALVVLPTRDLVIQVRETFEAIAKGRGLKIASVTGQHSFSHEQAQLVDKTVNLQGGSSKVDILICTPGRLMDHLNGTPNFSLQHLRFLVIDEADRLLAQSFQDWQTRVLAATRPPTRVEADAAPREGIVTSIPYPDALAPGFLHLLRGVPTVFTDLDEKRESSCQKLLFSATLMNDPGRIAALELRNPHYVVVKSSSGDQQSGVLGLAMEKFSIPTTLKEHMIVCNSSQKPLMLFHMVHTVGITNALVFTKSAESTQRLVQLFEFFEIALSTNNKKPVTGRAYSSDLSPSERKSILEKFKAQEIDMLVCSDLISRGIDIKHVAHVVNYDAPVDMRKYVHRVGRTARAGRWGDAWTLVEEQEARYFKNMIKAADHAAAVSKFRVTEQELSPLMPFYQVALAQLKDAYAYTSARKVK